MHESLACDTTCVFSDIPPFAYTLIATSSGFDTVTQKVTVTAGNVAKISLALHKTVTLNALDDSVSASGGVNTNIDQSGSQADKIRLMRQRLSYQNNPTGNSGTTLNPADTQSGNLDAIHVVYSPYSYTNSPFSVSFNAQNVFTFNASVHSVGANGYDGLFVFATDSGAEYIYDAETNINRAFTAKLPALPIFAKKTPEANKWIITFATGTVLYDVQKGNYMPNPLFDDYTVLSPGTVLWLIQKDDTAKKQLLNLDDNRKDMLILQTVGGGYQTVYQTDANLLFVQYVNATIIVTDDTGKKYAVQNVL